MIVKKNEPLPAASSGVSHKSGISSFEHSSSRSKLRGILAQNKTKELKINLTKKTMEKTKQVFKGRVIAAKTLHTATVLLESRKTHPLYKKSYAHSKKYLVEDDLGVKAGDLVEIIKCKNKHFKIMKVIGRDMEAIVTEQLKEEAQAAIEEVLPVEKEEAIAAAE